MEKVSSSIVLEAIIDGATLTCSMRAGSTTPLKQRFNSGTGKYSPDITALADASKPFVYPLIVRSDTGAFLYPTKICYKYNGTLIATVSGESITYEKGYDPTGTSASNPNANFQVVATEVTYNGTAYSNVKALRIIKNLASTSNKDNDLLECYGTVEIDGSQVAFSGLFQTFTIEESTGNQFALWITSDNEGMITDDVQELTLTANIDVDGDFVADALSSLDGYKIRWKKMASTSTGESSSTVLATSQTSNTIKISASDVDSMSTIRAELINSSSDVCATDTIDIVDMTDPLEVAWGVTQSSSGTGMVAGYQLKSGAIADVAVRVVNRSAGETQSGYGFVVCFYDNAGELYRLSDSDTNTKKYAPTTGVTSRSVSVKYADVVSAGRHLKVFCTASLDDTVLTSIATELNKVTPSNA